MRQCGITRVACLNWESTIGFVPIRSEPSHANI
ncbi:transcriptional regulatory domain protein [Burkholderia pseudomallei MSHR5613]|nr:transcriptional regulatory domain protein [Burkholderia pseudomallei MSHR5613]